MKRTSIIFGAVLLLGITLNADTLLLRDGRRVQGQLISVQNNTIEFLQQEFNSSRVVRVDRDQVSGIEFGRVDLGEVGRPGQAGRVAAGCGQGFWIRHYSGVRRRDGTFDSRCDARDDRRLPGQRIPRPNARRGREGRQHLWRENRR